jgi:hypothetical protein
MTFAQIVTELLALSKTEMPSAATIKSTFASRATKLETGDPDLKYPTWAEGTRGSSDIFLTLSGDCAGMAIWEDSRGWGAVAELAVTNGTRADLEKLVGPMKPMVRNPDDFHSGPKVAAYVARGDKSVRVFAELDKQDKSRVVRLTIQFED